MIENDFGTIKIRQSHDRFFIRGKQNEDLAFFNVHTIDMKENWGKKEDEKKGEIRSSFKFVDKRWMKEGDEGRGIDRRKETILQSDAFSTVISSLRLACIGQAQNCLSGHTMALY